MKIHLNRTKLLGEKKAFEKLSKSYLKKKRFQTDFLKRYIKRFLNFYLNRFSIAIKKAILNSSLNSFINCRIP